MPSPVVTGEVVSMVENAIAGWLMNISLVLLILGSIVEVAVDIGDMDTPEFLPAPLSGLPPSHPATALATVGIVVLLAGIGLEMSAHPLPGGRVVVGVIAVIAFLFAGGFVFSGEEADG